MIKVISLRGWRRNPVRTNSRDRVKFVFKNQAGEHELGLNFKLASPDDDLRAELEGFLLEYGLERGSVAELDGNPLATEDAQRRLNEDPCFQAALQYLEELGVPPPERKLTDLYLEAAEEFVKLRDVGEIMRVNSPAALGPLIRRMLRGACRDISERLTTKLVNCPDFEVRYTRATCPEHAPGAKSIREHCVPLSPIHERILATAHTRHPGVHCSDTDRELASAEQIAAFLRDQFRVAFVSSDEDKNIRPATRMPKDWYWSNADKMLRYNGVVKVDHFIKKKGQPCTHCHGNLASRNPSFAGSADVAP